MNTLSHLYKLFHFNLTMSPLYVVKLKMTQKQPTAYAVHSVEMIVPDFWRKSFNVRFFRIRQNISLAVFQQKIFTFSLFLSKIYLHTQYG